MEWVDDAPKAMARTEWQAIASALRDNPGEWAKVADDSVRSVASYINTGRFSAFRPAGDYEAVSRGHGKRCAIYARFIG